MEGILPITSRCNMGCIFCSNAYNPKSCEVFCIPPRPLEDIKDTILWLGGSRGPVVIGESVTRINEGEPLTPVSYTHLDVYKRQLLYQYNNTAPKNGTNIKSENKTIPIHPL